jgi:uncharacterized membrane protein
MRLSPARPDEPRLLRLLKHRLMDERDARRLLDDAALDRLQQRIALSERLHDGEIRVCIEAGLPLSYLWRGATARDRALALFGKLGVWDTEHNNGVLIYLLLAEHAIEIVADRGLQRAVPANHWTDAVAHLAESCRANRHEEGLLQAIAAAEAVLIEHFPSQGDREPVNELPDRPVHA